MTEMSREEVLDWCRSHGLHVNRFNAVSYLENRIVLRSAFPLVIYRVPIAIMDVISLIKEKSASTSTILWIKETGIWNERADQIGVRLWNFVFRVSAPDSAGREIGAVKFNETEEGECAGLSLFPMLYGWDAYLFPSNPDFYVYISHDEYIELGFRDATIASDLANAVSWLKFELEPTRSSI